MPVTTDTGVWYRESEYAALEAALRKIIDEGDYTAPEGMKRIARTALETTVVRLGPYSTSKPEGKS